MFVDPNHDFLETLHDPATGRISGVIFLDDNREAHYFDKNLARLKRGLEKALPDFKLSIASKANNANKYLIFAYSDTNPGDYYLFDRDKGQMGYIAPVREQIPAPLSAKTKRVSIPVRDGSIIPGYLTIPQNGNGQNMPAVIFPHGGPAGRSDADWDYRAQFYASRGYIVLKPNFRGSTGYGSAFEEAGENQWGGLMQDDVTDATKWLISEGLADPNRICIIGSSYGGYAALMGVIKEPELYQCAVSVNGATNLPSLKTTDKQYIGGRAWIKTMGLEGVADTEVSPPSQGC